MADGVRRWRAILTARRSAIAALPLVLLMSACGAEGRGDRASASARLEGASDGWDARVGQSASSTDGRPDERLGDAFSGPTLGRERLAMTAKMRAYCLERGERATVTLSTKPRAAVAWRAIYADGKPGSPPPAGAGYGGYGSGVTRADGKYEAWWVVGTDAPSGKGYVEVVAASEDESGRAQPGFTVADVC